MRRGLRGLLIVLGMLWVAASAGASTLWNAGASLELRSFLVEDYGGALIGYPGDSTLSYVRRPSDYTILGVNPSFQLRGFMARDPALFGRRSFVPYSYSRLAPRSSIRAGGNPRFGRRDFIWYPSPITPPDRNLYDPLGPFPTLPGTRVLYDPLGRFPGFDGNDVSDVPLRFFEDSRPDLLLRRNLAEVSWRMLRDLVVLLLPYPNFPVLNPIDDWDSRIIMVPGLDLVQDGDAGEAITLFPGLEQISPLGARLEYRSDRFSYPEQDFGGGSASVVRNVALVPEPGTGALLLAGLGALAARRRLR